MAPTHPPDLIAEIRFLPTSEGGRQTACKSGYRAPQSFGLTALNDALHIFVEKEWVAPGESVTSRMWLLAPDINAERLFPGFEFTVQAGARIVGRGRVLEVLNRALLSGGA